MDFRNEREYSEYLDNTVRVPGGFRFFTTQIEFRAVEKPADVPYRMDMSCIHSDAVETTAALVTTSNRYPGAPVVVGRERIRSGHIRTIVVNNKVANVGAENGEEDARVVATRTAEALIVPEHQVLPVSTGVIGWRLPVQEMIAAVPELVRSRCSPREVAQAIMTTDRYPKAASSGARGDPGPIILGIAKGAGMVEPNLATMLGFFLTDARVSPTALDRVLRRVVDRSFNCLSIDSDQSTSDMVVALAGGRAGVDLNELELEKLWQPVADELAMEIVRNGEGTAHVIEVILRGCPDRELARKVGRHVVNSPLVKTAINGNDPNVGRILGALGNALAKYDTERALDPRALSITLAGIEVYRDRAFQLNREREDALVAAFSRAAMDPVVEGYPQDRGTVPVVLDFHRPAREDVRVLGSDLSHEYISVNADYRT